MNKLTADSVLYCSNAASSPGESENRNPLSSYMYNMQPVVSAVWFGWVENPERRIARITRINRKSINKDTYSVLTYLRTHHRVTLRRELACSFFSRVGW